MILLGNSIQHLKLKIFKPFFHFSFDAEVFFATAAFFHLFFPFLL